MPVSTVPASVEAAAAALMAQIEAGDRGAYTTVVRYHAPRIYALARYMCGGTGEAEEVTQEVCLKIWRRPGAWNPECGTLHAWLDRVTINTCTDLLRRRKWYGGTVLEEWVDESPDALAQISSRDNIRAVQAAIHQLPERQRAAILLVEYRGMGQANAARELGISLDALESLLARARRKLKLLLAPILSAER